MAAPHHGESTGATAQTRRPSRDSLGRRPRDNASDRWDGRGRAAGAARPPALLAERFRSALSVRRLLWVSLVLIPADLLAHMLGLRGVPLFVLSVVVLVPLAWLIGEATEQT